MGRIKSQLIKRTSKELIEKCPDLFTKDFEHNKKILGHTLPSKRMRNRIAGYIARLKKNEKKLIEEVENE